MGRELDIGTSGLGKVVGSVARPTLKALREQWVRRRAIEGVVPDLATVERELDEALEVLTGDAATLISQALVSGKGMISGRPQDFRDEHVREWLRSPEARDNLKRAVGAIVTGSAPDAEREEAGRSYAASSGDAEWFGAVLFDQAVAFLALTVDTRLSTGDRLAIQTVNARAEELGAGIRDVSVRVEELGRSLHGATDLPLDILARHVADEVALERRKRSIDDPDRLDRVLALAARVRHGALRHAPPEARTAAFRFAAHLLARAGRTEEAEGWLAAASAAGADDLVPDRARLAVAAEDWATALDLLRDRTDGESLALTLEAVQGRDGLDAALDYQAKYVPPMTLSGFMLPSLAGWMIEKGRWDDAEALLDGAGERQLDENPILLFSRARLRIALLTPVDQRHGVFDSAAAFAQPDAMRDDLDGRRLRSAAIADLEKLEVSVRDLRAPEFERTVEANRLFLQLGHADRTVRDAAAETVATRSSDPATAIDYAWLAMAHKVRFDDVNLRAQLEKARLLAGFNDAQLTTALQLAMSRAGGDEILDLVAANRDHMARIMPPQLARGLEIEVLARKGRIAEARERLAAAADALGAELVARLEIIVAEQEGENPVALRLASYERSRSEADLHFLVDALVEADDDRAGDHAMELWRRRHRTEDATVAANALFNAGRDADLDAFLDELGGLVDTSTRLREHRAWSLFRAGSLDEARLGVDALRTDDPDRASLRQLAVNIAMEVGDWHRLSPLVAEDFERQDLRDSDQLIQAAGIAHMTDNPLAEDLARAAVAKAPDDPHVLLRAYGLAIMRGRDQEPEAGRWLRRAIETSGEDGPIQRADLRELIRMREAEAGNAADLDRLILSGQVPLSLATGPLGTTLSELILARLAENPATPPRRRLCLPLVAGNRFPIDLSGAERFALDPNAILTLQLCGLLETALEALPAVVIPAGTMPLLAHDLEKATRGQPSRAEQAGRLKTLVDAGRFTLFDDEDGDRDDFAPLHARADAMGGRVVHTFPLYEPGSLNESVRDPAPFVARLASPDAVISSLARRGEITADEGRDASAGVAGLGGVWPDEGDVDLDRPLVLHPVVLNALEAAGVLDRLIASGAELHITRSTVLSLENEIGQRRRADDLRRSIEAVRNSLAKALSPGGRATSGRFQRDRRDERGNARRRETEETPLVSLLQDASAYDVLVSGDRMVNGHTRMNDSAGGACPVATPVDVIDHLARIGAITPERRRAARLKLREAGVAMIPVTADELVEAAVEGDWARGAGRSLRAIRASIHLPVLRRAVTMPTDRIWLQATILEITLAIKDCWVRLPTADAAERAADYLFAMMPAPAVHGAGAHDDDAWVNTVLSTSHALLATPIALPEDRLPTYLAWHEGAVRERLYGRDRGSLDSVFDRLRHFLLAQEAVEAEVSGASARIPAALVRGTLLRFLPRWMIERLTDDPQVREALGEAPDTVMIAGRETGREEVAEFFRAAFCDAPTDLLGMDGMPVATAPVGGDDGIVRATVDGAVGRFEEAGLFADDARLRTVTLDRLLRAHTMAAATAARWRDAVADAPPTSGRFMELMEDMDSTPEAFVSRVTAAPDDGLGFHDLVDERPSYFCNLFDPNLGDGDLGAGLAALAGAHASAQVSPSTLLALAPLAVSPDFPVALLACGLDDAEVAAVAVRLAEGGDPFSALAGFQIAAERFASGECRDAATGILERLLGLGGGLDDSVHDFVVTGVLTLTFLDLRGTLADVPLAIRRCAALAHAGHAVRSLRHYQLDREGLLAEVRAWAGGRWSLGSMIDRFEAGAWMRELLIPEVLGPYVLRRLADVIERVPEPDRPHRWTELISARQDGIVQAGAAVAFGMPGPLDEFGRALPIVTEDGAGLLPEIASADFQRGEAILHTLLWAYRPPADASGLERGILDLIGRMDVEAGTGLLAPALAAAARWRLGGLAEGVVDLIYSSPDRRGLIPTRVAEMSVLAAAAASPESQSDALGRHLGRIVFGSLIPEEAAAVARFIDVLENYRPEWIMVLERLRTGALLASG